MSRKRQYCQQTKTSEDDSDPPDFPDNKRITLPMNSVTFLFELYYLLKDLDK